MGPEWHQSLDHQLLGGLSHRGLCQHRQILAKQGGDPRERASETSGLVISLFLDSNLLGLMDLGHIGSVLFPPRPEEPAEGVTAQGPEEGIGKGLVCVWCGLCKARVRGQPLEKSLTGFVCLSGHQCLPGSHADAWALVGEEGRQAGHPGLIHGQPHL